MPPFAYKYIISNMNHFSNVRQPKNAIFTKGIIDGLAIKAHLIIQYPHITLQYMMQLGSWISHMQCFLHNIGVNKQMIIYQILMVFACNSCKMNANSFATAAIHQNNLTESQIQYLLFLSVIRHGKILAFWQKTLKTNKNTKPLLSISSWQALHWTQRGRAMIHLHFQFHFCPL